MEATEGENAEHAGGGGGPQFGDVDDETVLRLLSAAVSHGRTDIVHSTLASLGDRATELLARPLGGLGSARSRSVSPRSATGAQEARLAPATTAPPLARRRGESTFLHVASAAGHVDVVRALLRAGAPAEVHAASGKTAFQLAPSSEVRAAFGAELIQQIVAGDLTRVTALLDGGMDPGFTSPDFSPSGDTPLHWAASFGHLPLVRLLVGRGARLNATNLDHATPLHEASHGAHAEVVSFLVGRGADVSVVARRGYAAGKTALEAAMDDATRQAFATGETASQPQVAQGIPDPEELNGTDIEEESWGGTTALGGGEDGASLFPLLWPPPKHVRPLPGGDCGLAPLMIVRLPDAPAEVAGVRSAGWEKLTTTLRRFGVHLQPTVSESRGRGGMTGSNPSISTTGMALTINPNVLPRPMSFRLTVCRDGVLLVAADAPGLYYGVSCLCQLLSFYAAAPRPGSTQYFDASLFEGEVVASLPAVWIDDYPDFGVRAVLLDARFPSTPRRAWLLSLVERLAAWRINAIHLVLDDGVDLLDFQADLNSKGEQSLDLLELDALCQRLFITLVPAWRPEAWTPAPTPLSSVRSSQEPSLSGLSPLPLDRFRQVRSRQLSLIFSETETDAAALSVEQVTNCLQSVVMRGHYQTIHLWGLSPEILAAISREPLRWMPVVLSAVQDFPSLQPRPTPVRSSPPGLRYVGPSTTIQGAALSKFVKGGVSGTLGPSLRLAPLLCSLMEAAVHGMREGASGMMIQSLPWQNPLYPLCLSELCIFAGAGIAWERRAASACLGISSSSVVPGPLVASSAVGTARNSSGWEGGMETNGSTSPGADGISRQLRVDSADSASGEDVQSLAADNQFALLASNHLYSKQGDEADIHRLAAVACTGAQAVRHCWQQRRESRVRELDEVLWQLHVAECRLPGFVARGGYDSAVAGSLESPIVMQIAESFKEMMRLLRDHSWKRQEGLRWMDPEIYGESTGSASPVQRALDELHVAIDLVRLSCRLIQQIVLVNHTDQARSASRAQGLDLEEGQDGMVDVSASIRKIPASKRSDLANRLLDIYQRFAVLWSKSFSVHGLPVAFKQPPELLMQLTFDLPNFQVDQIYQRIFVAKKMK